MSPTNPADTHSVARRAYIDPPHGIFVYSFYGNEPDDNIRAVLQQGIRFARVADRYLEAMLSPTTFDLEWSKP